MTLDGEYIACRCAGHSCSDRNRCACHVKPIPEGLVPFWMPWYDARKDNKCPHFQPEETCKA
jgi:hypothetical protein